MPQLIVRNVEEKLVRKLKERAGQNGLSMEEQHRRILRQALCGSAKHESPLKEYLLKMPDAGPDALFERTTEYGREVKL